jgi:hypothetical protein
VWWSGNGGEEVVTEALSGGGTRSREEEREVGAGAVRSGEALSFYRGWRGTRRRPTRNVAAVAMAHHHGSRY